MNVYSFLAVMVVAMYGSIAISTWSDNNTQRECYKAAQVNTNITCKELKK